MTEKIIDIINNLKNNYPMTYFSYFYHQSSDIHEIWHNNILLRKDKKFKNFCGELILNYFLSEKKLNLFIDYSAKLSSEFNYYWTYFDNFNSSLDKIKIINIPNISISKSKNIYNPLNNLEKVEFNCNKETSENKVFACLYINHIMVYI